MTKTTVHALLIGINAYRDDLALTDGVRFNRLRAPVADAKKMQQWLEADPALEVKAKPLHDAAATKSAVVKAFREDLALAGPDDVVLVYYSGHGVTEHADPAIWTDQRSGRLEALACYFDAVHPADFLLTDKELRFLLHELYKKTKAHIVAIFDCCHSGDNTRGLLGREIIEKRVDYSFPRRDWSEFVFAEQIKPADVLGRPVSDWLPQAPHVQFSASESDEPALEVDGQSVFTAYLLDALRQSGGRLSYRDLHSRVRNRLRAVFVQKPKLYAPNEHRALLDGGFLKKNAADRSDGQLVFNLTQKAWVLDRGAAHGVEAGTTRVAAVLPDGKTVEGVVTDVHLDDATLRFEAGDGALLNSAKTYAAQLSGLRREVVRLRLVDAGAAPETIEAIGARLAGGAVQDRVALEDDPDHADYDLMLSPEYYYLTRRLDPFRPLVAPVAASAANAPDQLANQLAYLADWTFIHRLTNSGPAALPADAIGVQFFRVAADGTETPLAVGPERELRLAYEPTNDPETPWGGRLKVIVTNRTEGNLYVLAGYQMPDFSSETGLLEPPVKLLEKGGSEPLLKNQDGIIPFGLDHVALWYNWPEEIHTLKFVFSTLDFNPDNFEKAGLPRPLTPDTERDGEEKGLDLKNKPALNRWGAVSFTLTFPNPEFDQNKAAKAARMSALTEAMKKVGGDVSPGWFAAGLYR